MNITEGASDRQVALALAVEAYGPDAKRFPDRVGLLADKYVRWLETGMMGR